MVWLGTKVEVPLQAKNATSIATPVLGCTVRRSSEWTASCHARWFDVVAQSDGLNRTFPRRR